MASTDDDLKGRMSEDFSHLDGIAAEDPYALLDEWFAFWRDTPEMPVKVPNALHIRTAVTTFLREQELKASKEAEQL